MPLRGVMQPQRSYTQRLRIRPTGGEEKRTLSYAADFLTLLLGLLTSFSVHLVGSLPICEFLLIPLFPVLLATRGGRVLNARMNPIYILLGVWLFGQVATDIYRSSPQESWMRGTASIVFFGIDIVSMVILAQGKPLRQVLFLSGLAGGIILSPRIQPTEIVLGNPWKFAYSAGIAGILLLIACHFYKRNNYAAVGILIAIHIFANLLFNFRSMVFFLLVLAVLILPIVPERIGRIRLLPRQKTTGRVVILAGLALFAGAFTITLITFVTRTGLAGEEAQEKNMHQLESKQGILLSGRPEIQVSSQAVLDSPILGHGSEARDPKYVEMLYDIEIRNGGWMDLEDAEQQTRGTIPTHSHLMGAWVSGGICGAIFWAYLYILSFRALVVVSLHRPPLAPVYGWLLIQMLWNIPFSPFGSTVRINEALAIVIIVDLLRGSESLIGVVQLKSQRWRRTQIRRTAPVVAASGQSTI
jgi:hypothetical protein